MCCRLLKQTAFGPTHGPKLMAAHAWLNDDFTHVKCLMVSHDMFIRTAKTLNERAFAAYPHNFEEYRGRNLDVWA